MDANVRRTLTSYVTYGTGLGIAHATSSAEGTNIENAIGNLDVVAVNTAKTFETFVPLSPSLNDASSTWLMSIFPELVNSGHLTLVNGHIYFFDVSASQLLSMLVAFFSLIFIIARGISDLSLFFLKWKLDSLEEKERIADIARKKHTWKRKK